MTQIISVGVVRVVGVAALVQLYHLYHLYQVQTHPGNTFSRSNDMPSWKARL